MSPCLPLGCRDIDHTCPESSSLPVTEVTLGKITLEIFNNQHTSPMQQFHSYWNKKLNLPTYIWHIRKARGRHVLPLNVDAFPVWLMAWGKGPEPECSVLVTRPWRVISQSEASILSSRPITARDSSGHFRPRPGNWSLSGSISRDREWPVPSYRLSGKQCSCAQLLIQCSVQPTIYNTNYIVSQSIP